MTTYMERFESMVNTLQKFPYVEIVRFERNPPITTEALKHLEKKLDAPLATPLRQFYGEANGLHLRWRVKLDTPNDKVAALRRKSSDYYVDVAETENEPFAKVNLIPLEQSFARRWQELEGAGRQKTIEFRAQVFRFNDFKKRLKPFDLFSTESCMAFFVEKGNGNPPVQLLTDYCFVWNETRVTDFESYIEMVIATYGIVESRKKIFGQDGEAVEPPLLLNATEWKREYTPKLFQEED